MENNPPANVSPHSHPWNISTSVFEGPLDVLLALIRNKKKDIADISLATICSSFLDYLAFRQSLTLETDSNFIEVAASLILIKSRSILPADERADESLPENELDADNLEISLKEKLIAYQKVQKLSLLLDNRDRLYRDFFHRPKTASLSENPEKVKVSANIYNFTLSYKKVLAREKAHQPYIFDDYPWNIEESITKISTQLKIGRPISFASICSPTNSKARITTNLMAILEMAKLNQLAVMQSSLFSDFFISSPIKYEK
ncbi:MAG: segregation/condensation protein A [SAR324 cluster bacterium]|nr:segregation/condensation protein A [SAR324 cluster bacterium]